MKYLKEYKLFENREGNNLNLFDDLFTDLKDDGFNLRVEESTSVDIDFSKSGIINSAELIFSDRNKTIKTIDVSISYRRESKKFRFLIDDIKENLLFVESYAKNELGLELAYIYTQKVPQYMYYKSVEYLPFDSNWWIDSITFAFTKKDEGHTFESVEHATSKAIVSDVNDICLELNDINIENRCHYYSGKERPYILFGLEPQFLNDYVDDILWYNVEDVVLRVLDYMDSEGWKPSYIIIDAEAAGGVFLTKTHHVEHKDAKDFLAKNLRDESVFCGLQIDFIEK